LIKPAAFQAGVPPQAEHLTPDTWHLLLLFLWSVWNDSC